MGDGIFKVCATAMLCALIGVAVRRLSAEIGVLLKVVCGILLAALCVGGIAPIVEFVRELSAFGDGSLALHAEFMLKVLSIAILSHICATACRDCGEGTVASYVEFFGKVEIIILSLPYISDVIGMSVGLL